MEPVVLLETTRAVLREPACPGGGVCPTTSGAAKALGRAQGLQSSWSNGIPPKPR